MRRTQTAPGAVVALVCGILAVFAWPFAFVFGPFAIVSARRARAAVDADPRFDGGELANAGRILGWLGFGSWIVVVGGVIAVAAIALAAAR